jgi:peptidoglycan/LPS O-acetylase OafA/YrhL
MLNERINKNENSGHFAFLDSLRGLAALTVIASHYVLSYGLLCKKAWCDRLLSNTPFHIWWDGYAAVSLFFVLSGFVLSLKSFKESESASDLCIYWRKQFAPYVIMRFFRIGFPYGVAVLLGLLFRTFIPLYSDGALVPGDWFFRFWNDRLSLGMLLKELDLLGFHELSLLPQAWTLSIELVISLFIPLGIMLVFISDALAFLLAVFMLFFQSNICFVFHFLIGIILAKRYVLIGDYVQKHRAWQVILLCVGLFFYTFRFGFSVYLNEYWNAEIPDPIIFGVSALGSVCLLASVLASKRLKKHLLQPALCALGRLSYSIYLIHFAVLLRITPWFFHEFKALVHDPLLAWCLGLMVTISVSVLLAIPSFKWVEMGGVRIGRWLLSRYL